MLAVVARRPDDEREVDLRRLARRALHSKRLRQRDELVRRERLGARLRGPADRGERLRRLLARGEPGERQRVRERLAPVREGGGHDFFHAPEVWRQLLAAEGDERRVDVRRWPEDGARDGVEAGSLGRELHEHGNGAVSLRPGLGEEPVGDLPLHHHAPEPDRRQPVEALDDERGRDVVREVGHQLRRVLRQLDPERVAEDEVDVRRQLVQRGLEGAVDLDRVDAADALREVAREHSLPGADLEHDVVRAELCEPPDHLQDVAVDQEVLAVLLLHRPKHALALPSICRSSSSGSSPRARASAATVWTTFAGSFGLPRRGWGAR